MLFTNNQVQELLDLINFHHLYFVATNVGGDVLSDKEIGILKDFGIKVEDLPKNTLLNNSFKFGVLAEILGDKNASTLNYSDFKKYIKKGDFIPLNTAEKLALEHIKNRAYNDIKGLGDKVSKDVSNLYVDSSQNYKNIIKSEAENAVKKRLTVKELATNIARKTGDWERDLSRISDYIMHEAYEEGRAASMEKKNEGRKTFVFKDVYPGACRHCIRLYLTGGIGSQPIIFDLEELRANGTNIGRKPDEWKATLGPCHPWCRCTINELPEGYEWNDERKVFTLPSTFVRKVQRKSKITITIGDKEFKV